MGREMLNNPPETAWHGNDFKGSDVALLKGRSFLDVLADTGRIPRREEALPRATALAHDLDFINFINEMDETVFRLKAGSKEEAIRQYRQWYKKNLPRKENQDVQP